RDRVNKVAITHGDGAGALYYTATLHVDQPVDQVKATNRGFSFVRVYYVNGRPVTSAHVGDVISVSMDVTVNDDRYYVNVEEPIPAGTELLDTSLQTTAQLSTDDPSRPGNGWFDLVELKTEKIILSRSFLGRGTYRFTYQLRA